MRPESGHPEQWPLARCRLWPFFATHAARRPRRDEADRRLIISATETLDEEADRDAI
jgi:hypothetical protein